MVTILESIVYLKFAKTAELKCFHQKKKKKKIKTESDGGVN